MKGRLFRWSVGLFMLAAAPSAMAEDGYDLWLRYARADQARTGAIAAHASVIAAQDDSPTIKAATQELQRGVAGMTGTAPALSRTPVRNALWLSTSLSTLALPFKPQTLGTEGYAIRSTQVNGQPVTLIAANSDVGLLHGAYHWLRLAQTGASLDALDDLLYGGFGELLGVERPVIVLRDHAHARDALGIAATGAYYREKIAHPEMFHVERFEHALAELDAGRGETYFDLVLGVFADHDDVRLVLD